MLGYYYFKWPLRNEQPRLRSVRSVIKIRNSGYNLHQLLWFFCGFVLFFTFCTQGPSSPYKFFHDKETDSQCKTVVERDYFHLINLAQHIQKYKNTFIESLEWVLLHWCLEWQSEWQLNGNQPGNLQNAWNGSILQKQLRF